MLWSFSLTPSDLILTTALASLAGRSLCAGAAVLPRDSIPAFSRARSGFLDTVASPLARIAESIPEAVVADRTLTRTGARLTTITAATATEQATTTATGMTRRRKDWGMWRDLLVPAETPPDSPR